MKLDKFLKAAPSRDLDPEYSSVRIYLNEMKSYLHELKALDIVLLEEGTAGHSLISHSFLQTTLDCKKRGST